MMGLEGALTDRALLESELDASRSPQWSRT